MSLTAVVDRGGSAAPRGAMVDVGRGTQGRSLGELGALALAHPGRAVRALWALAKGRWYTVTYPLRGVQFTAGRNFRVIGRLDVRGPGSVAFGDNVVVLGHATPWTYTAEARIVIGDNALIGDTKFGCAAEITIGRDCVLANASIQDTDFHSTHVDRRSDSAPVRVSRVTIGDNVWIAQFAGILPGARIGHNCVVGFGTVCAREYPDNVIILGHPGKVAGPVPGTVTAPASASSSGPSVYRDT